MNKKINSTLGCWLLVSCLWLASCNDFEERETMKEVQMQLSVIPLSSGFVPTRSTSACMDVLFDASPLTRSATVDENRISNIALYQFSGGGGILSWGHYLSSNTKVAFKVDDDNNHRVCISANVEGVASGVYNSEMFDNLTRDMNSQSAMVRDGGIPMIGSTTANINTGDALTIALTRMVAKLNFTYKVAAGVSFTPTSVTLKDVPTKVRFMSNGASDPGDNVTEYALSTVAERVSTVYIPENLRGRNESITAQTQRNAANAPARSTYIELKGIFCDGTYDYETVYCLYLGSGDMKDFNVQRNSEYNITATIKGVNTADSRVTVGEKFINLSRAESANCYIVNKTQTLYSFNATVRGNNSSGIFDDDVAFVTPSSIEPKGVKVLWEMGNNPTAAPATGSVVNNVKISSGRVMFTTGTITEGNALIAVYDDAACTGNILWSWHIWSTASTPEPVLCEVSSGSRQFYMMSRNLGAANNTAGSVGSFGLLYQWGRKDPFPGGGVINGITPYASTPTFPAPQKIVYTVNQAIANPTQFVYGGQYDWCSTQVQSFWGNPKGYNNTELGSKSIYDPCPPGYYVSSYYNYNGAHGGSTPRIIKGTTFTTGYTFRMGVGETAFFIPAAGYCANGNGLLASVGVYGAYWTSSPNGSGMKQAWRLYLRSGYTDITAISRAAGHSVRCTKL